MKDVRENSIFVNEVIDILKPFAEMARDGDSKRTRELACERGYASDKTILVSADFAAAKELRNRLLDWLNS